VEGAAVIFTASVVLTVQVAIDDECVSVILFRHHHHHHHLILFVVRE